VEIPFWAGTLNEPALVATLSARLMVTDGLTAMFTSWMEKLDGSVLTEVHVMVTDWEKSTLAPPDGLVILSAEAQATRAARMDALKYCILVEVSSTILGVETYSKLFVRGCW